MKVKRFAISVPKGVAERFERKIKEKGYESRSKAVAEAMNRFVASYEADPEQLVASMMFKVDKNAKEAGKELDRIKRHYSDAIFSSTFVPSQAGDIEVLVLRGKQCVLRKLKGRISAVEGVGDCRMHSIGLHGEKHES